MPSYKTKRYVVEDHGFLTPCWIWQLHIDKLGYGHEWQGGQNGKPELAHRMSYIRTYGLIPSDMQIDHACDVKACVNPEHLRVVTPSQNVHRRSTTKLTADDVREIRERAARGETQRSLAPIFGVAQTHISRIVRGERWHDLSQPVEPACVR